MALQNCPSPGPMLPRTARPLHSVHRVHAAARHPNRAVCPPRRLMSAATFEKYANVVLPVGANGTDGTVPPGALALEAEHYTSEASYKREQKVIFSREWMCLGLAADLERPGAYRSIDFAGYSVFAVRDRHGDLKGFHNVCRHRAGPLVSGHRGQCDVIRCRYHGWVYNTEGRLKRAPAAEFGPQAPDASQLSLLPVRVESWQGLVFCSLAASPRPLSEELKDLEPLVAPHALHKMHTLKDWVEPIACNWKTYVDNYMEGYHIRDVHPLLNQTVSMNDYRVHVGKRGRFAVHTVPVKEGQTEFEGEWIWLYPSLALNIYKDSASIERMLPTGPRTMQLHYSYVSNEHTAHEQADRARAASELVTAEDKRICELVQRNLESGMYKAGPLSPRHENGVYAFHQWLRAAYADEQRA